MDEIIGRLNSYVRGWLGYFGFCETPSVLRELEGWLHRSFEARATAGAAIARIHSETIAGDQSWPDREDTT